MARSPALGSNCHRVYSRTAEDAKGVWKCFSAELTGFLFFLFARDRLLQKREKRDSRIQICINHRSGSPARAHWHMATSALHFETTTLTMMMSVEADHRVFAYRKLCWTVCPGCQHLVGNIHSTPYIFLASLLPPTI